MTVDVTDLEQQVVQASHEASAVDFWAEGASCRQLGPFSKRSPMKTAPGSRSPGQHRPEPGGLQRYGIPSIPAVKLFAGGEVVDELSARCPRPRCARGWRRVPNEKQRGEAQGPSTPAPRRRHRRPRSLSLAPPTPGQRCSPAAPLRRPGRAKDHASQAARTDATFVPLRSRRWQAR